MLNPTSSVVKWFFFSDIWVLAEVAFWVQVGRSKSCSTWSSIIRRTDCSELSCDSRFGWIRRCTGVYNLFRRIYQYVEEICKEILFIGCFILRIYLQAFVLSTKKCADDESCDPPEDSPRHITLREQSSHKASYFRLLQKISIKNHWNSITTEKLSFELQIFSVWTGGRKDFSSKICVNRSLCQFSAQLFSTPEWSGSYGALHRGHIFFCRVGLN